MFQRCVSARCVAVSRGHGAVAASFPPLQPPPAVGRRKALAWFGARPFDLDAAERHWRAHPGLGRVTCAYPALAAASAAAAATAIGAGSGAAKAAPPVGPGGTASPRKPLEMLCFSQYVDAPDSDTGLRKATFVVFAEGTIVGWDASWLELVATHELLRGVAGSASTTTAGAAPSAPIATHPLAAATRSAVVESIDFMEFHAHRRERAAAGASGALEDGANAPPSAPQPTAEGAAYSGTLGGGAAAPHGGGSDSAALQPSAVGGGGGSGALAADGPHRNFIDAETDTVVLADADDRHKIPFSFALSQSVKLDAVEFAVVPLAADVRAWQRGLLTSGRLRCTVRQLRRAKTQLLALSEYLNFKHNVQTTPRLFWTSEFQHLRGVYKASCEHLEIEDRGTSLKERMDTIDESIAYFHSESHASSNERLTWIIIWLIAVELVVATGLAEGAMRLAQRLVADAEVAPPAS